MRTISADAIQTLSQQYGVEPVTLIKVFWSTLHVVLYGDRTVPPTVKGSILELSAFDDIVNFDGNKATQTFNITLDDADESIKAVYDVHDIHKAKVQVFQWFSNIPLDDMFLIFEGEINSPIVWREGERSLTFSVVSQIEDQEIGFSPEEGIFDEIPDDLVGKPFPLIFGFARNVPAIKLDPIPLGILLDTFAAHDPTLIQQINKLYIQLNQAQFAAISDFYKAITAYNAATGPDGDESFNAIGDQYVAQGNQQLQKVWTLEQEIRDLTSRLTIQRGFETSSVRVHQGQCFPQGTTASTQLTRGTTLNGTFMGGDFQINGVTHPLADAPDFGQITPVPIQTSTQVGGTTSVIQPLGLIFEPPDQPFKLTSPIPIRFICCMLECAVLNVWAYRNYNDTRLLMQVPTEYYSVSVITFGTMPVTIVTLEKPLSYYDSKWDDSLYVDLQSPIGPNTASVLIWMIENYTTKGIDSASFNHVAALVAGTPSNFAMLRQENIIKVLSDIAYQSRCALLLKNDIFYLKFLPEQPAPVATITLDDILVNTLELNHSSTENLITKLVGTWVPSYEGSKANKVIVRNNTAKYGIHEQSVDWFIYTNPGLVDLGASFWCIRKSNTWKLIKFKTPLTKIALESFDAVRINFASNWVCNGPVTGIIDSVKFNTKELNLEFEVWLPILLGMMTQYNFAWPPDSDVDINPANIDFQKIGYDANGNLGPANGASNCGQGFSVKKGNRQKATHPTVATVDDGVLIAPAPLGLGDPQKDQHYGYDDVPGLSDEIFAPPEGTFPGIVVERVQGNTYRVSITDSLDDNGNPKSHTVTATTAINPAPVSHPGDKGWVTVRVLNGGVSQNAVDSAGNHSASTVSIQRLWKPDPVADVGIPGKITDHIDASHYLVDIYEDGVFDAEGNPLDPTQNVTVRLLQTVTDDVIPNDAWVDVNTSTSINDDGQEVTLYSMTVPIYL